MSVQIFVRGKLLGIGNFLVSPSDSDDAFLGRSGWLALLTEVLPRALLADLGLSRILLGSSGGDQFMVLLPSEYQAQADSFLAAAAADIAGLSGGIVRLIWSITENLGDWSDIRKRLNEQLAAREATPLAGVGLIQPADDESLESSPADDYFSELARALRTVPSVSWSTETPGRLLTAGGKHTWQIDGSADSILFARHSAPDRESRPLWGVLRGDVDNFLIRIRRLQTIEEFLQLSLTFKQFFAGELTIRCSMPAFWQKVSVIYTGGDDFSVYGDWDALLPLAREIQRVFQRFAEENLKDLPGPEGKTITMAVALAPSPSSSLSTVYEEAGENLHLAKTADKDCIYALGRILEWKQLSDAADLKDELTAMISRYGASPEYIQELCGLYRETAGTRSPGKRSRASERPWRFHRKLGRILPVVRDREGQKVRADIIAGFVGRNPANVKLRPSGRVALEWARLVTEETALSSVPAPRESRRAKKRGQRPERAPATPKTTPQPAVAPVPLSEPVEIVPEIPFITEALVQPPPPPAVPIEEAAPAPPDPALGAPDSAAEHAPEESHSEPPGEPARPEPITDESPAVSSKAEPDEPSPENRPE